MFEELLERLERALSKHKIPYMIIGGQAVLVYGEPRFSKDIDLTLGMEPAQVDTLLKLLKPLGFKVLVDQPKTFVETTCILPCQDAKTGLRLDFIFSFSAYERQALERVRRVPIGKSKVAFASAEDLVIHKIIAGRPRDLEDVKGILLKNPSLDVEYIRRWLAEFEKGLSQPFLRQLADLQRSLNP